MARLLFLFLLFVSININGQNVGIGTTSPHPSATLELNSTSKGILIPRLKQNERLAINTPANGLMVFDLDTESFWWSDSNEWIEISSTNIGLRDKDSDTKIEVEKNPNENIIRVTAANTEVGQFLDDQFYLNGKASIGTLEKKGLLTISGNDDPIYGPNAFLYGPIFNQVESGRIRFAEGLNWLGGYIHYNGFTNKMHLGMHNIGNQDAINDVNAISIDRASSNVGINNDSPSERLSIDGNVKIENGNIDLDNSQGITIQTTQNQIQLKAGNATITLFSNGDIDIDSPTGTINMDALDINMNAMNINLNASVKTEIQSTVTDIQGSPILLNGDNNGTPAARVGSQANGTAREIPEEVLL